MFLRSQLFYETSFHLGTSDDFLTVRFIFCIFAPESSRSTAVCLSVWSHEAHTEATVPLLRMLTLIVGWDGVCSEELLSL